MIVCPVAEDQSALTDDLQREQIIEQYFNLQQVANVYIMDMDYNRDAMVGFNFDNLHISEEVSHEQVDRLDGCPGVRGRELGKKEADARSEGGGNQEGGRWEPGVKKNRE